MPLVMDTDVSMEVAGFAALTLGLVFTSTCKEDVVEAIITALMSRWGPIGMNSPKQRVLGAVINIAAGIELFDQWPCFISCCMSYALSCQQL